MTPSPRPAALRPTQPQPQAEFRDHVACRSVSRCAEKGTVRRLNYCLNQLRVDGCSRRRCRILSQLAANDREENRKFQRCRGSDKRAERIAQLISRSIGDSQSTNETRVLVNHSFEYFVHTYTRSRLAKYSSVAASEGMERSLWSFGTRIGGSRHRQKVSP